MTTLREAAQQALEALEDRNDPQGMKALPAMTALRAALAEPQEPVAWTYQNAYTKQEYLVWKKGTGGSNWQPLYTAPPQRKPLTEEEIKALPQYFPSHETAAVLPLIRAIEQAHRIGSKT